MKYTNAHGLPEPIYRAIVNRPYSSEADASVTQLYKPMQMLALERKYRGQLYRDISEELYALLGTAAHKVLEFGFDTETETYFVRVETDFGEVEVPLEGFKPQLLETRLFMAAEGITVSGQVDLLEEDGTLSDYKTTSVYSFLLENKPEWEFQLNVYGLLAHLNGHHVTKLQIVGLLRDWTKSKSYQSDYPEVPITVREIPLWPLEKTVAEVKGRVTNFKRMLDGEYEPCTPEERWATNDTWAVKKKGNKSAEKVCDSEVAAQDYIERNRGEAKYAVVKESSGRAVKIFDVREEAELMRESWEKAKGETHVLQVRGLKEYEIEFRPGKSRRCEYCSVGLNGFCQQWEAEKAGKQDPAEEAA